MIRSLLSSHSRDGCAVAGDPSTIESVNRYETLPGSALFKTGAFQNSMATTKLSKASGL